ncbi:MAG: hypothetical protein HYW50_02630 [Candidatus Diapherotrites archaeon]|nr:hypothetical protein [Candidatus Diapherotrites archaeon]
MRNLTLSIDDKIKAKMHKHPQVRWSNAVRTIIERKLKDFEEAERIASKSKIFLEDIQALSKKVEKDMAQHAKRLLDENNL